jgi:hypothetical protein
MSRFLITVLDEHAWRLRIVVEGKTLIVAGVGEQGRSVAKHVKKIRAQGNRS